MIFSVPLSYVKTNNKFFSASTVLLVTFTMVLFSPVSSSVTFTIWELVIENGIVIVLLESFTLNVSLAVIVLFSTIRNSNVILDFSQLSLPIYLMVIL